MCYQQTQHLTFTIKFFFFFSYHGFLYVEMTVWTSLGTHCANCLSRLRAFSSMTVWVKQSGHKWWSPNPSFEKLGYMMLNGRELCISLALWSVCSMPPKSRCLTINTTRAHTTAASHFFLITAAYKLQHRGACQTQLPLAPNRHTWSLPRCVLCNYCQHRALKPDSFQQACTNQSFLWLGAFARGKFVPMQFSLDSTARFDLEKAQSLFQLNRICVSECIIKGKTARTM